jgi:uncharacterized membrane protein
VVISISHSWRTFRRFAVSLICAADARYAKTALCYPITALNFADDIAYLRHSEQRYEMKQLFLIAALLGGIATASHADCYADYKAKQDAPLRLIYGVAQLPDNACSKPAAQAELKRRLGSNGWTLLAVLSTFGSEGLDKRKASAGQYFLRY